MSFLHAHLSSVSANSFFDTINQICKKYENLPEGGKQLHLLTATGEVVQSQDEMQEDIEYDSNNSNSVGLNDWDNRSVVSISHFRGIQNVCNELAKQEHQDLSDDSDLESDDDNDDDKLLTSWNKKSPKKLAVVSFDESSSDSSESVALDLLQNGICSTVKTTRKLLQCNVLGDRNQQSSDNNYNKPMCKRTVGNDWFEDFKNEKTCYSHADEKKTNKQSAACIWQGDLSMCNSLKHDLCVEISDNVQIGSTKIDKRIVTVDVKEDAKMHRARNRPVLLKAKHEKLKEFKKQTFDFSSSSDSDVEDSLSLSSHLRESRGIGNAWDTPLKEIKSPMGKLSLLSPRVKLVQNDYTSQPRRNQGCGRANTGPDTDFLSESSVADSSFCYGTSDLVSGCDSKQSKQRNRLKSASKLGLLADDFLSDPSTTKIKRNVETGAVQCRTGRLAKEVKNSTKCTSFPICSSSDEYETNIVTIVAGNENCDITSKTRLLSKKTKKNNLSDFNESRTRRHDIRESQYNASADPVCGSVSHLRQKSLRAKNTYSKDEPHVTAYSATMPGKKNKRATSQKYHVRHMKFCAGSAAENDVENDKEQNALSRRVTENAKSPRSGTEKTFVPSKPALGASYTNSIAMKLRNGKIKSTLPTIDR